jgi:hypothetical protein
MLCHNGYWEKIVSNCFRSWESGRFAGCSNLWYIVLFQEVLFPRPNCACSAGCDGPQYWIHFYLPTGNIQLCLEVKSETCQIYPNFKLCLLDAYVFKYQFSWKRWNFLTLSSMSKQLSSFKFHLSRNISFPHQNTSIPSIGRLHKRAGMVSLFKRFGAATTVQESLCSQS